MCCACRAALRNRFHLRRSKNQHWLSKGVPTKLTPPPPPEPQNVILRWKEGLCTCNPVKRRFFWMRVGPKSSDWWRKREGGCVLTDAEAGVSLPLTEEGWQPAEARRGEERFFPRAFAGSRALLPPSFGALSLWTCETTHFCCFKPLGLWPFSTAALGN